MGIFVIFQQIAFKLESCTNFNALFFPAKSMDFT